MVEAWGNTVKKDAGLRKGEAARCVTVIGMIGNGGSRADVKGQQREGRCGGAVQTRSCVSRLQSLGEKTDG